MSENKLKTFNEKLLRKVTKLIRGGKLGASKKNIFPLILVKTKQSSVRFKSVYLFKYITIRFLSIRFPGFISRLFSRFFFQVIFQVLFPRSFPGLISRFNFRVLIPGLISRFNFQVLCPSYISRFYSRFYFQVIFLGFISRFYSWFYFQVLFPVFISRFYSQVLFPGFISRFYSWFYFQVIFPGFISRFYFQVLFPGFSSEVFLMLWIFCDLDLQYRCTSCQYPLCGPDCQTSSVHAEECTVLSRGDPPVFQVWNRNSHVHCLLYHVLCAMCNVHRNPKMLKETSLDQKCF